jgi:uncharacterized protein (TIGR03067 family)
MRRFLGLLVAVALAVPTAMPARADDDASKGEAKKFEGSWKFVSLESDGATAPADVIETWRWSVKGDEITWSDPKKEERTKTSFKIVPDKEPKAVDITALDGPRKGKTFRCIYKFEKDRLTICLPEGKQDEEDRPRPEAFEGGKGFSLIVLERVEEK